MRAADIQRADSGRTVLLWSKVAPLSPTAKGNDSTDGDSGSGGNARLQSKVGYGFAAFSGNAVITPYGILTPLSQQGF